MDSFRHLKINDMRATCELAVGMRVNVSGTVRDGKIERFDADRRLALVDGGWYYVKDLVPAG